MSESNIKNIINFSKKEISKEVYEEEKLKCKDTYPYVQRKYKIVKLMVEKKKNGEHYYLQPISTYMRVVKKFINMDNQIINVVLEYYDGYEIREVILSSEIFSKNGLKEILNYGVRYCEAFSNFIIEYLTMTESLADIFYTYKKLGWNDKDSLMFKSHKVIGKNINKNYIYKGNIDIVPSGNLTEWTEMVESEVIGNVPLEFVLLASFASPIISLLNTQYDLGAVVFNLSNTSSKGKTTSAMLGTSIFSNPMLNRGAMITFNATDNALYEFISQANGITISIDEAILCKVADTQKMLYTICSGRSKMRLNGDSELKEIKEFSSVILTTAEFNLIDDDDMDGVKTRVFELTDSFTTSAENSENIKKVVLKNYGVAGDVFISHLVSKGEEVITEDYEKSKECLRSLSENHIKRKTENNTINNNLVERIISKLAIVDVSLKYYNEIFEKKIDRKGILKYILKIIKSIVNTTSSEEELLNIVLEEVQRNLSKYYDASKYMLLSDDDSEIYDDSEEKYNKGYYGIVRESSEEGFIEICVLNQHFKELMKRYKVPHYNKILKTLKKRTLLLQKKTEIHQE